MITVELDDVKTGPDSTIEELTLTDARSIKFLKAGSIIIETANGSLREVDVKSVLTIVVTVENTDLIFDIAGS
jgi:hypothetical protein